MLNAIQFESRTVEEATGGLRGTSEGVGRGLLDWQKGVLRQRFEQGLQADTVKDGAGVPFVRCTAIVDEMAGLKW